VLSPAGSGAAVGAIWEPVSKINEATREYESAVRLAEQNLQTCIGPAVSDYQNCIAAAVAEYHKCFFSANPGAGTIDSGASIDFLGALVRE
jgi:hypothetical protein